jgi:methylmalonyl-CoA mutase N-terminal domain/subunit
METDAMALIREIDRLGGMVAAIEAGFPQRTISDSAYAFQRSVETGEREIVGVNVQADEAVQAIPTLSIDDKVAAQQIERVKAVRKARDGAAIVRTLAALEESARGAANLLPALVECAGAYATIGEMTDVLRKVWGEYEEAPEI